MIEIVALSIIACQGVDNESQCQPWMQQCLAEEFALGHDKDWAFEVCAEAYFPPFFDAIDSNKSS
jgi:hypothetical protein